MELIDSIIDKIRASNNRPPFTRAELIYLKDNHSKLIENGWVEVGRYGGTIAPKDLTYYFQDPRFTGSEIESPIDANVNNADSVGFAIPSSDFAIGGPSKPAEHPTADTLMAAYSEAQGLSELSPRGVIQGGLRLPIGVAEQLKVKYNPYPDAPATRNKKPYLPNYSHYVLKQHASHDPRTGLFFDSKMVPLTMCFFKGKVYNVPNCLPPMPTYLVSRKTRIESDVPINFREHSGAGFGGPKFFEKPTDESFGIEIETMFHHRDPLEALSLKLNFCNWLGIEYPNWIAERDGSLEEGLSKIGMSSHIHCCAEIVSPPSPYRNLREDLSAIVGKLQSMGASAQRVGDFFAIHVTSNIYKNPSLVALRFARVVNATAHRNFWLKCSYRPNSDGFVGDYGKAYCRFDDGADMMPDSMLINITSDNHYRALYLRSQGSSAELRIFQTRIKREYILNILELNMLLSRFCHGSSDLSSWLDYVKREASTSLMRFFSACRAFEQSTASKFE